MSTPLRSRYAGPSQAKSSRPLRDQRREALLARLEELILDRGFADLTMDQVAARLKCSKSALYALAPSKEQLVTLVVKRFFREATSAVEMRVASVTDPTERVAAYLAGVGEQMRRMSPTCYADMVRFPVTGDIYDLNSRAAAEHVRQMIQDGIKQGIFRSLHARFIGEAASVLIESIQHGGLLERVGLSSGDAYAELSSLVLGALTSSEPVTSPARRSRARG